MNNDDNVLNVLYSNMLRFRDKYPLEYIDFETNFNNKIDSMKVNDNIIIYKISVRKDSVPIIYASIQLTYPHCIEIFNVRYWRSNENTFIYKAINNRGLFNPEIIKKCKFTLVCKMFGIIMKNKNSEFEVHLQKR